MRFSYRQFDQWQLRKRSLVGLWPLGRKKNILPYRVTTYPYGLLCPSGLNVAAMRKQIWGNAPHAQRLGGRHSHFQFDVLCCHAKVVAWQHECSRLWGEKRCHYRWTLDSHLTNLCKALVYSTLQYAAIIRHMPRQKWKCQPPEHVVHRIHLLLCIVGTQLYKVFSWWNNAVINTTIKHATMYTDNFNFIVKVFYHDILYCI